VEALAPAGFFERAGAAGRGSELQKIVQPFQSAANDLLLDESKVNVVRLARKGTVTKAPRHFIEPPF
jgi:hypothetical protein